MTLNGVLTADARYLCDSSASYFSYATCHARPIT